MTLLVRPGSWDAAILGSLRHDYPDLQPRFAAEDWVLDLGCHIGGFSVLAAELGARVRGYEASLENFHLARVNTSRCERVEVPWAAVWRSDVPCASLAFRPCPEPENTGGGGVVEFAARAPVPAAPLAEAMGGASPVAAGSNFPVARLVPAVALDDVLRELGRVRLLKIDVEGAEFPILMTSRELDRIDSIVGEVHLPMPGDLSPNPVCADIPFDPEALRAVLEAAGFALRLRGTPGSRLLLLSAGRRPPGAVSK